MSTLIDSTARANGIKIGRRLNTPLESKGKSIQPNKTYIWLLMLFSWGTTVISFEIVLGKLHQHIFVTALYYAYMPKRLALFTMKSVRYQGNCQLCPHVIGEWVKSACRGRAANQLACKIIVSVQNSTSQTTWIESNFSFSRFRL